MTERSERIYSTGVYARLSTDSGERKNESIETQVEIAKDFIGRQSDMELYNIYTDLGKTGTNFERGGFERMMHDVRRRKINCIVVKDLSRFGRNHIETGNYIEKIFPFMGVRFVAVTDNFDSMNLSGPDEAMSVNLKNLVNEMYARDIAAKVKAGRRARWEQGSYTGGTAPYGYRVERTGDKRRLLVEEAAAGIVRKIFELFLSGKNRKEIVAWLYENKVARPVQYHKSGQVYCRETEEPEQWSGETVKMILTNPVYMGCLVRERICGKDYMMRERNDLVSGNWAVKEHTHEAIVSRELFFEAAGKFRKYSARAGKKEGSKEIPGGEDAFAALLYCGCCGSKMKRTPAVKESGSENRGRAYSYKCPRAERIDRLKCEGKKITAYSLTAIVKEAVRQEFILSAICPEDLAKMNRRETEALKKEWERELAMLDGRLEGLRSLGSEQYFRYRMGETDAAEFKKEKEENDKKAAFIREESRALAGKLRKADSEAAAKNHFLCALMKGKIAGELTSEIVRTLIQRIEVYPEHRVKVIFAFERSEMPAEEDI